MGPTLALSPLLLLLLLPPSSLSEDNGVPVVFESGQGPQLKRAGLPNIRQSTGNPSETPGKMRKDCRSQRSRGHHKKMVYITGLH
ncbi:hypothetical protein STEG23_019676 [Scotinomys teguina]